MGDTEILGNLVVGKEIAALGKIEASSDIQANGAIIADGGFQGDSAYIKNDLSVGGRIYGQMDASGITSGTINPARLPSLNSSYTYSANAPQDFNPSWTRIMTIDKTTGGRFTPLKFNILGSRGIASSWPPNFDEDYYLRYRRDTTTEDLANTYYYDCYRKSNYNNGGSQLIFVRISNTVMDVYLYREYNYFINGSISFNKLPTDVITTYTEPVLTTAPDYAFPSPTRLMDIPPPPTTGANTLISDTGNLMWISTTLSSEPSTDITDSDKFK
jgi:hypothetical protein